jgi:hypothetical protein
MLKPRASMETADAKKELSDEFDLKTLDAWINIHTTKTLVEIKLAKVEAQAENACGGSTGTDADRDPKVWWIGILGCDPQAVWGCGRALQMGTLCKSHASACCHAGPGFQLFYME